MTIVEAIKKVLEVNSPLGYKDVYQEIVSRGLYSFGAKDPEGIVNNKIRKHCVGLNFPSASPLKFFKIAPQAGGSTKYELFNDQNSDQLQPVSISTSRERLPEERLHEAFLAHRTAIRHQLLEELLSTEPAFFERLVVDLLIAMGYGGNFPDAGDVRGGPGDGGIDGEIREDKLGLNKIFIQAKRYTERTVGRPEIQQFVGAMEHNLKGVFITTSSFSKDAKDAVGRTAKNIVLVDGETLCDLMMDHGIGVATVREYSTLKINSDYFKDS